MTYPRINTEENISYPDMDAFLTDYLETRKMFIADPRMNGEVGYSGLFISTKYQGIEMFIPDKFFAEEAIFLAEQEDGCSSLANFIRNVFSFDSVRVDSRMIFPRQLEELLSSIEVNEEVCDELLRKVYMLYYASDVSVIKTFQYRLPLYVSAQVTSSINRIKVLKKTDGIATAYKD